MRSRRRPPEAQEKELHARPRRRLPARDQHLRAHASPTGRAFTRGDSFPAYVRGARDAEDAGRHQHPGRRIHRRREGARLDGRAVGLGRSDPVVVRDARRVRAHRRCDLRRRRAARGRAAGSTRSTSTCTAPPSPRTPTTARASCWRGCARSSATRCRSSPAWTCTPTSPGACSTWPTRWCRTAPIRTSTWPRPARAPPSCWRAASAPAGASRCMRAGCRFSFR